jgi:hypothetical protein
MLLELLQLKITAVAAQTRRRDTIAKTFLEGFWDSIIFPPFVVVNNRFSAWAINRGGLNKAPENLDV